jgi:signal transduction histidine kinase
MAAGLTLTQEWPENLALILLYASAFSFVAAYAAAKEQAEAAGERGRVLLADLQRAYDRLEAYAAQAERFAVVEERTRLARDLHDSVSQTLYGLALSAEAAARTLAAGEFGGAADQVRELRETALQAQREMRLLIFELRPPLLEQEGLAASLRARLGEVEARSGLATSFAVEGEKHLPIAIEAELDRIAQEALNNTLKHAHASRIAVRLHVDDGCAELAVADDGVGFNATARRSDGGLGLRGMEERAARLGGRLVVESAPGRGTRVTAEVPR